MPQAEVTAAVRPAAAGGADTARVAGGRGGGLRGTRGPSLALVGGLPWPPTPAHSASPPFGEKNAPQRPQADTHDAAPAHEPQAPPPAPGTAGAEAPDEALLEFLGTFSTEDGQWLDPLSLDDETPPRARGGGEEGR